MLQICWDFMTETNFSEVKSKAQIVLTIFILVLSTKSFSHILDSADENVISVDCTDCSSSDAHSPYKINMLINKYLPDCLVSEKVNIQRQTELANYLAEFEHGLDPYYIEKSVYKPVVTGVGAISTGFEIEGLDGFHIRRYSGFVDHASAVKQMQAINHYRVKLKEMGIHSSGTCLIAINVSEKAYSSVYIVQPFLRLEQRVKAHIEKRGDQFLSQLLDKQLLWFEKIITFNEKNKDYKISVDLHLDNLEIVDRNEDVFEIRLNDFIPVLLQYKGEFVFDFSNLALSVLYPFSDLFIKPAMVQASSGTFTPSVISAHLLYGYEQYKKVGSWGSISNWWYGKSADIGYPEWIITRVNQFLISHGYSQISEEGVKKYLDKAMLAQGCVKYAQRMTQLIRHYVPFNSEFYMHSGNASFKRLGYEDDSGFFRCLPFVLFHDFPNPDQ